MKNNYFTVLPANVRYDSTLPPNAKILFSELLALCGDRGFCWASNGYLARLFNVDKATVSRWISKLHKRGYIFFEPIDEKINTDDNYIADYRQIYLYPLDKNINPNNKSNNKKSNISRAKARTKNESFSGAYNLDEIENYINNKDSKTLVQGNEVILL